MMYKMIKQEQEEDDPISTIRACCILGVNKSSYYKWDDTQTQSPDQQDPHEMELRNEIQKIAVEFSCYGYRRITRELRRRGYNTDFRSKLMFCNYTLVPY